MKSLLRTDRLLAILLLFLPSTVSGCWFGDPVAYSAIQAYTASPRKEEIARIVDGVMGAAGARPVREWTFSHAANEIGTTFALPESHTSFVATISAHKGGSLICVEFSAGDELDDIAKAAIVRVRSEMIDTFGEDNVANSSCLLGSNGPYWPG